MTTPTSTGHKVLITINALIAMALISRGTNIFIGLGVFILFITLLSVIDR